MFEILGSYLDRTKTYSPIRLTVELAVVGAVITGLLFNLVMLLGIMDRFPYSSQDVSRILPLALLFPPLETISGQVVPYLIMRNLAHERPEMFSTVVGILFSALHYSIYGFGVLAIFPVSFLLCWLFVIVINVWGRSWWVAFVPTTICHILVNGITFSALKAGLLYGA